jgi:uncharacterized membrane protein YfcA
MTGLYDVPANLSGSALLAALSLLGAVVGVLTGLFGVGGAFMIVPLLNVLLGVPYTLATGCSMCFTIGSSSAGWSRHMGLGNVATKTMLILAGSAVAGTVLGAELQGFMAGSMAEHFTAAMHALFLVVLGLTAWLVWGWSPHEPSAGGSLLQRLSLGPKIEIRRAGLKDVSLPGLCAVGLGIGVLKGLLGIGGGVLFMPVMLIVVGLSMRHSVGTSLGVVLLSSLAGAIIFGAKGQVSLWVVMPLLVGSSLGVQLGAWLCQRLHAGRIQRWFVLLVLAVMAIVGWDFARKLLQSPA